MTDWRNQREYDHERYMAHREERKARQREYYRDYISKGLSKPRKPKKDRRQRDREYYQEHIEERRAYQRQYYAEHREEILRKKHERGIEKYVSKYMTTI